MADHSAIDHTGLTGVGGSMATDALWDAAGDLAQGTGANTAAKLGAGSSGQVLTAHGAAAALTWETPSTGTLAYHGVAIYHSADQAFSTSGEALLLMDSEDHDTDAFHFGSAAALTGTVAKNGTTAIVGSGTSFTTELSVGQVISIPGTAVEYGVIAVITDNTHLTLYNAMVNSASGQTATRVSGVLTVPSGLAGRYDITAQIQTSAAQSTYVAIRKNSFVAAGGTLVGIAGYTGNTTNTKWFNVHAPAISLAVGDMISIGGVAAAANNAVHNGNFVTSLKMHLIGA